MGLGINEITWLAVPTGKFKAGTSYQAGSPKPNVEVRFGPTFLSLLSHIVRAVKYTYLDMLPVLHHELYHAWEKHKLSTRPNLTGQAVEDKLNALSGTAHDVTDAETRSNAIGGGNAMESELLSELVEYSALNDLAGSLNVQVVSGSRFSTVNSMRSTEREVNMILSDMRSRFGPEGGYAIIQQLQTRVEGEPWFNDSAKTLLERTTLAVFSDQVFTPQPKGSLGP